MRPERGEPATTPARGHRVWLGVGAVFTVAALLVGAMGVVSAGWVALQRTSAETRSENHSYTRPVSRVEAHFGAGAISLSGTASNRVDVRRELTWAGSEPDVDETWAGDTLVVDASCPNGFPYWVSSECSVDYDARVPAGTDVQVDTTTAPIDVRNVDGDLALTATTGSITAADVTGALSARATTGDITGSQLRSAKVDTEVGTGDIDLSFTEPPDRVTAVASTGDVTIEVPRADGPYHVDVQTTTGEQRVDVAQDPQAEPERVIHATTSTGDVHIRYLNHGGGR